MNVHRSVIGTSRGAQPLPRNIMIANVLTLPTRPERFNGINAPPFTGPDHTYDGHGLWNGSSNASILSDIPQIWSLESYSLWICQKSYFTESMWQTDPAGFFYKQFIYVEL